MRGGEVGDVQVEARVAEAPVAGVAVRGLEVARPVGLGRVPQPAPQVGQQRQARV